MLKTPKYGYCPIDRVDGELGRFYAVPDTPPLPSVTTILSASKDDSFLDEWRIRVGDKEAKRITEEAANIGTLLHKNLENHILGVGGMVGAPLVKMMTKSVIANGLSKIDEYWGVEAPLYFPGLYAGTADLVAVHGGDPSIVDFKNSLGMKREEWIDGYFMQLVAYALAHNEMFGTDIKKGVIMMSTRDGKYLEFLLSGEKFDKFRGKWLDAIELYYR